MGSQKPETQHGLVVALSSHSPDLVNALGSHVPEATLRAAGDGGAVDVCLVDADILASASSTTEISTWRSLHPEARLVVVSSDTNLSSVQALIRAGIDEFIARPVDAAGLAAAMRYQVARRSSGAVIPATRAPAEAIRREQKGREQLQKLNRNLRKHVSQLTILYQMGRDISDNENWSDALDRWLMALVNYLGAEGSALLLFSEEERRLQVRSNFQVDPAILSQSCQVLLENWKHNPRGNEIHCIEGYREGSFETCLERSRAWRYTVLPVQHRNRVLGFLFVEKEYRSHAGFSAEYNFFNTIQTILAEEVVNAVYISELRRLTRFNKKVLDNIKSGVVTTDLDGAIRFYNEHAASMCPALAARRVMLNEIFETDQFGDAFYERVIDGKKDTYVLEAACLSDDSTPRFPVRVSVTRMHDDGLNGTVLVAIFEDLTEQKRMQSEIRRNDRLRAIGQLSAGVAHEIRNPLTGIATSAEVLGGMIADDDGKRRYIRAILDEIRRLDDIIRNLLDFARPAKPQLGPVALGEVSERVVTLLRDQAQQKRVHVEVDDRIGAALCRADGDQMTQVLLNVVQNSIQACEEGGEVRIVLRDDPTDAGRPGAACIDVIDNGAGVPESLRHSLFDPFVTSKTTGTGLGLSISQQIVEEHNGRIECEFLQRGTRFSIHLPLLAKNAVTG